MMPTSVIMLLATMTMLVESSSVSASMSFDSRETIRPTGVLLKKRISCHMMCSNSVWRMFTSAFCPTVCSM